jgi:hypothetical protein
MNHATAAQTIPFSTACSDKSEARGVLFETLRGGGAGSTELCTALSVRPRTKMALDQHAENDRGHQFVRLTSLKEPADAYPDGIKLRP